MGGNLSCFGSAAAGSGYGDIAAPPPSRRRRRRTSCDGRRGRCGRATRTGCGTSASGTSTGRRRSSSPSSMPRLVNSTKMLWLVR
uniref:Uncharacterized protein n=1 Tax=Oryza rufipogon TaxID=4529 RepID=A0A0E0Q0G9_ORYRU